MRLRLNITAFFWVFVLSSSWAGTPHALTLQKALDESLSNSRELASSREAWVAARESVYSSSASGGFGLTFNGSGSASSTDSGTGFKSSNTYSNKITLSKDIYDFGKVRENTTLAEINLGRAYANYKNTEQRVILDTANAYLGVIKARRELKLNEDNIKRLAAHVSAAKLRVSEGTDTPTGLAEAVARYSRAEADKILAVASVENAEDLFQKLTEINENGMSEIAELPELAQNLPKSILEAATAASENNPNVLSAIASEEAAAQTIKTTQAQQTPNISLSLSGTKGKTSDSLSLSLSFTSDLYESQSTVASARKAVADHSKARIDLEEARAVAELEAGSAFRDWQAAVTSLKAVKSEIDASRLVADGVRNEVNFGLKTQLDLLDAEKGVKDAEIRLVSAEHQKLIAGLKLSSAMGTLTTDNLGLKNDYENLNSLPRPQNPLASDYAQ